VEEFRAAVLQGFEAQDERTAWRAVTQLERASVRYRDQLRVAGFLGLDAAYVDRQQLADTHLLLRDTAVWVGDIELKWARLSSEVRPRLEEVGLHWLPTSIHLAIDETVKELKSRPSRPCRSDLGPLIGRLQATLDPASSERRRLDGEALETIRFLKGFRALFNHMSHLGHVGS
jgi:hypothetical protein